MTIADATAPPFVPFAARGALSAALIATLTEERSRDPLLELADDALSATDDVVHDDDVQLSLFVLYASHYGSIAALRADLEWDLELVATRQVLEAAFEARLRRDVSIPPLPAADGDSVARALFEMTAPTPGGGLARFIAKNASIEQASEFLIQRSVYTLREADPHSWAIPRLTGRAKAALVEIQADEYGGGDVSRMHSAVFAATMRGAGLDDSYAAYLDAVPAATIASLNMMSMFGLNRRLRGAIVGHLAAFEMTSSLPNRSYADGFRRLGFGDDVTDYFDVHVEADAVHEQIAARDLAGALVESEPALIRDVFFGAAACLHVDELVGAETLDAFEHGRSSLRQAVA